MQQINFNQFNNFQHNSTENPVRILYDKFSLSTEQAYTAIILLTCMREVPNSKQGQDKGFKRSSPEQISGYYLDRVSDLFLWNPFHYQFHHSSHHRAYGCDVAEFSLACLFRTEASQFCMRLQRRLRTCELQLFRIHLKDFRRQKEAVLTARQWQPGWTYVFLQRFRGHDSPAPHIRTINL